MRFTIGARVHYRAYPSGVPVTDVAGTVVDIGRHATKRNRLLYVVEWDGIDYARYSPTNYEAGDLALAEDRGELLARINHLAVQGLVDDAAILADFYGVGDDELNAALAEVD